MNRRLMLNVSLYATLGQMAIAVLHWREVFALMDAAPTWLMWLFVLWLVEHIADKRLAAHTPQNEEE